MGTFSAAGNPVTSRVSFNSGTIDFGNNRLVNVENIKIDQKFTEARMYVLNSILPAAMARHSYTCSISGQVKSFTPEMEMLDMGSSTSGTPVEIDVLDAQPTLLNPVITCYDSNAKQFQYQVQSAMFTTNTASLKNEDFTTWDFTLEAISIKLIYTT
jgi:hypothetical protein